MTENKVVYLGPLEGSDRFALEINGKYVEIESNFVPEYPEGEEVLLEVDYSSSEPLTKDEENEIHILISTSISEGFYE